MFFNKAKTTAETEAPKKRSVLGLLFNPEIGKSLQPLGETTGIFVQLIAMIFAMNGLFPKNHPAIQGVAGARLTLTEIFSTSWQGLSFTKAGIPKVILFFAVTGTIVFAILSTITALLAGFMGTAHAAPVTGTSTGGIFSPAGADDLAQNWLDYIFKGIPLSHYYSENGQPIAQTTSIQCSMISALGFYSNGMLVFAAVILFYHLISMVVMTAHEGVPMGKRASQVWAPIRLVFAVGLLVPMGSPGGQCSTSGAGLNAGQYIVIQMASWGSGLASQTWKTFLDAWAEPTSNFIRPSAPIVSDVVKGITLMEACRFAWNYNVCMSDTTIQDHSVCATNPNSYGGGEHKNEMIAAPIPPTENKTTHDLYYRYTPENMADNVNVCGSIIIRAPTSVSYAPASTTIDNPKSRIDAAEIASRLATAHQETITDLIDSKAFEKIGAKIAMMLPGYDGELTNNDDYWSLVADYQSSLKENLDLALAFAGYNSPNSAAVMASLGWASAGAWINTIARDQGVIVNAYENGLPETRRPDLSQLPKNPYGSSVASALGHFSAWINHQPKDAEISTSCIDEDVQRVASSGYGSAKGGGSTGGQGNGGAGYGSSVLKTATAGKNSLVLGTGEAKTELLSLIKVLSDNTADGKDIVKGVFAIIDTQAKRSGVWGSTSSPCGMSNTHFSLGTQLVTSNPLQEFSFWGHANLRTAYSLWQSVMELSVASVIYQQEKEVKEFTEGTKAPAAIDPNGKSVRDNIVEYGLKSQLYSFIAGIFALFASIFMMTGFTVAFVTPLIPYFRFFFNVLTWIVSTLEAVVAIPLVALAHLNPEGEGLPGQSAKSAYFLIFNIFVRPVMTVFGLIAGLIVFYIAIMLLNITFAIAVAGTNAVSHADYDALVRIAFTVTYSAAVYTCANNAFKTIGFFPEHAMRWVGQQAHHERMGDGGRSVQAALGQTQGVLGEKAISAIRLKA